MTDELLDVIAQEEKIVKYLDIPIQHCSEKVLRAMNRTGGRETLKAQLRHIRERVPGIVLRTTVMTGFPGEGKAEFEELCEFIKETLSAWAASPFPRRRGPRPIPWRGSSAIRKKPAAGYRDGRAEPHRRGI